MTNPGEDFTTWTEVDPTPGGVPGRLRQYYNIVSKSYVSEWVKLRRNDPATYLYKDFGVQYFIDFVHDFELRAIDVEYSSSNRERVVMLVYTNDVGAWYDIQTATNKAFGIMLEAGTVDGSYKYSVVEWDGNAQYQTDKSDNLYTSGTTYCRLTKDGRVVTLEGWSDAGRTDKVMELSFYLRRNHKLQYMMVPSSLGYTYGDNDNSDGWVSRLILDPATGYDTEDLKAVFTVHGASSRNLFAKFLIPNDHTQLFAKFEVNQVDASIDLAAEFEVRQETSVDLAAEFYVQIPTSDLKAVFIVAYGQAELYAKFFVTDVIESAIITSTLNADLAVTAEVAAPLASQFDITGTALETYAELKAVFVVGGYEDLKAIATVRQLVTKDLKATFDVLTDGDLYAKLDVDQQGVGAVKKFALETEIKDPDAGAAAQTTSSYTTTFDVTTSPPGVITSQLDITGTLETSADLKAVFIVGGYADLKSVIVVQHTATKNLKATFDVLTLGDLFSKFDVDQIGRGAVKKVSFDEDVRSADLSSVATLSSQLDITGTLETYAELKAVFEITEVVETRDLFAKFVLSSSDSTELFAEFMLQKMGIVELFSEFNIRQIETAELLANFTVRHTDTKELYAEIVVQHADSADLKAVFEITGQQIRDLFSKFLLRQLSSTNLFAKFVVRQANSKELFGKFITRFTDSVDVFSEFEVRQEQSRDLFTEFVVKQSASVGLFTDFVVQRPGSEDLFSEMVIRQTNYQNLIAKFIVQQPYADLKTVFWVKQPLEKYCVNFDDETYGLWVPNDPAGVCLFSSPGYHSPHCASFLGNIAYIEYTLPAAPVADVYLAGWFSVGFEGFLEGDIAVISGVFDSDGPVAGLSVDAFDNHLVVSSEVDHSIATGSTVIDTSSVDPTWYYIEFHVKRGLSDGVVEVWLNGELEAQLTSVNTMRAGLQYESVMAGLVFATPKISGAVIDWLCVDDDFIPPPFEERDLFASFEVRRKQAIKNLFAEFELRHPGTADLYARFRLPSTVDASVDLPAEFSILLRPNSADLSAKFYVRHPTWLWTTRRYVNGVIDLTEIDLSDALLEYTIEGVMVDIQGFLVGKELSYNWANILEIPKLIKRATTYGVAATLYARGFFDNRIAVSIPPRTLAVLPEDRNSGMEYWESRMEAMLKRYVSSIPESVLYVDTYDEEPVFTMDDIPSYSEDVYKEPRT